MSSSVPQSEHVAGVEFAMPPAAQRLSRADVERLASQHGVSAGAIEAPRPSVDARGRRAAENTVSWWPPGFGTPAAAGAQNAMRYAFFPAVQRLIIDDNGTVSIYDTGDTYLTGVSQQQSSSQLLHFTSSEGRTVSLSEFKRVSALP